MNNALERAKALIEEKMALGAPVIAALEGGAATGKSTLAAQLSAHFSAPVISMDEFFLPPALRTEERFREAGGNIHYERFEEEVASPLRAGEAFSYRVFDCSRMDYGEKKRIEKGPLLLIEGVYCLHPRYRDIYSLRFFLETAQETQDQRLKARGEWLYERFQNAWLPMEKLYFDTFHPKQFCDAVLRT